jgi:hypothetical protein
MSSLVEKKNKNNSSLQFKTDYSDYLNPYNKSNSIYFRDTIKQFCPHQRYVDHRPYPYRSFVKPPTDFNYFNNPTEKDSFVPCFKNYPKRELLPLVTRQDLAKYLKNNGKLISHKRPCNSCSRINYGNYGRNYYTIEHKSFPFINGNFTGTNFRVTNGFSTLYQTRKDRKRRLGYKIKDYDKNQTNGEFNNEYYENQKITQKIKIKIILIEIIFIKPNILEVELLLIIKEDLIKLKFLIIISHLWLMTLRNLLITNNSLMFNY